MLSENAISKDTSPIFDVERNEYNLSYVAIFSCETINVHVWYVSRSNMQYLTFLCVPASILALYSLIPPYSFFWIFPMSLSTHQF